MIGTIAVFLDDERPCPEGWTLARTSKEFFALLDREEEFLNQVTHLSLDWYLGGLDIDGVQVAKRLAEMFLEAWYNEKVFLPKLEAIGCHSSDREQAHCMATELKQIFEYTERQPRIRIRLGTPYLA